jgi:hypothetical protein
MKDSYNARRPVTTIHVQSFSCCQAETVSIKQSLPFSSPSPTLPGNHLSIFYLSEFVYFGYPYVSGIMQCLPFCLAYFTYNVKGNLFKEKILK